MAGVVDQVVQTAVGFFGHRRDGVPDLRLVCHVEPQEGHVAQVFERAHCVGVARGREDMVAFAVEDDGEGGADAAVGAAGDEDVFGGHFTGVV